MRWKRGHQKARGLGECGERLEQLATELDHFARRLGGQGFRIGLAEGRDGVVHEGAAAGGAGRHIDVFQRR